MQHAMRFYCSCFEDIIKPTQQILKALADFFENGRSETALAEDPSKMRSVTWVCCNIELELSRLTKLFCSGGSILRSSAQEHCRGAFALAASQGTGHASATLNTISNIEVFSQAAEQVELPLKPSAMKEDSGDAPSAEQQAELLSATFKHNEEHPNLLRTLAAEATAALQFIVTGMWELVAADEKEEVDEELGEEDTEGVTQEAVDQFKADIGASLAVLGVQLVEASGVVAGAD